MDAAPLTMPAWLKRLFSSAEAGSPFPAETSLDALRYVVVDTELTSLDSATNRILSIGAITMDGTRIRLGEQFYEVINPGTAVPAETVVIHGLRPVDVLMGSTPAHAITEFLKFAGKAVLAGHFVAIDLAALKKELPSAAPRLDEPAVCTARVQRWLDQRRTAYPVDRGHHVENVDLASLVERHGIETGEPHHALSDAFQTAMLWQRLIPALEAHGIRTLAELLRIGRASR
ncbi:MAG TPA: 3'-5' exonuclease [Candidatus Angelobacter sp.]|nr:3'-5' exonuclease [Candidatus Angelobacter sp.]